jgi:hypothetical protein
MGLIGIFEKLESDFNWINTQLALNSNLPWVNCSQTKSVANNFYSDVSKHSVYSFYEEDFDSFEYPHQLTGKIL